MTDLLLAVIAASVLIMAAVQVVAMVFTARTVRSVEEAVARLEHDVRPIVASLQAVSFETARATGLAAAQVERADRLFADLARRLDASIGSLQHALVAPAREGMAVIHGIRAAVAVLRALRESPRRHPVPAEEDDPLFIG